LGAANLERGVWSIVLRQARDRFRICNRSESENVLRAVGRLLSRLSEMEIDAVFLDTSRVDDWGIFAVFDG
jgi:hypothetical protein